MKSVIISIGRMLYRNHHIADKNPKKIAVFKIGAIGDMVMASPFLHNLRDVFPKSAIDVWVGKFSKGVLENNPHITSIHSFDESMFFRNRLFGIPKLLSLVSAIRKERYDCIFILDKSYLVNQLIALTRIQVRIGFNRRGEGYANTVSVPYTMKHHEIDNYNLLLSFFNKKRGITKPEVFPSLADENAVKKLMQRHGIDRKKILIGLFCGGARNPGMKDSYFRRWPQEKFAQLISRFDPSYVKLILGAKSDYDEGEAIRKASKAQNVCNFCGRTSILQSAVLAKYCSIIVCNDSGPMHLSSAVNDSIVSIWSVTNPFWKAPRGRYSNAIWKGKDAYTEGYDYYGTEPSIESAKTINRITVNDVYRSCMSVLHKFG